MYHVAIEADFNIDPKTLWEVYTDHQSWKKWTIMPCSELVKTGIPHKNGTGAIRRLGLPGIYAYEEITLFKPYQKMEYRVIKGGLPFKNHHGVVSIEDHGHYSRIFWHCRFDSKIPGLGPLFKLITIFIYRSSIAGLKRHLAKQQ